MPTCQSLPKPLSLAFGSDACDTACRTSTPTLSSQATWFDIDSTIVGLSHFACLHPMSDFTRFVSVITNDADNGTAIEEASGCLDRFTSAFNLCDPSGMDAALDYPHLMISGADRIEWSEPGQHPPGFFDSLRAAGWASTRYLSKHAVLASADKVHFLVEYTRNDTAGRVLSTHRNLWIVIRRDADWRIAVRSY
jgi:hypothetical protein